jgi:phosphoglycerol transferase
MKKSNGLNFIKIIDLATYFAVFFPFFFVRWIVVRFGAVSFDQIIFHMSENPKGLTTVDVSNIYSFLIHAIVAPLFAAILLIYFSKKIKTKDNSFSKVYFKLKPRLLILLIGLIFSFNELSFGAYVGGFFGEDYFSKEYVFPETVKLSPGKKKSILLVYIESLDSLYSDEKLFGKNLLKGLNKHLDKGVSFNNFYQMPGASWTIAGISASQCGVPLKRVSFFNGNDQGSNLEGFLSSATCLSDILKKNGYLNIFMGGASLEFAGKRNFFKSHQYDEVYGREEWIDRGYLTEKMHPWGLQDDDLFTEVKKKLKLLIDDQKLFNLSLLTLNSHSPGYLSDSCLKSGFKGFEGVVECTANQVGDLVDVAVSNGWLDHMNILIMGDHVAMENPVYEKLTSVKKRRIFNLFISKDRLAKSAETITHFDVFPTLLDFVGLEVSGGRMGLGRSGFSLEKNLFEEGRENRMSELIMNYSPSYVKLWEKKLNTSN